MARIPANELDALRGALRDVMRGSWRRRRPPLGGDERLGRRHVAILALVGSEEGLTVGRVAEALGLSLPAVSKLAGELAERGLLERREDPADRRRTVLHLGPAAAEVRTWLDERDRPLVAALETLTPDERAGFLKGMHALADALMRESAHGPLGSHDRGAHRRGRHRHRPL